MIGLLTISAAVLGQLCSAAAPVFTAPGVSGRTVPISETTQVGRSVYRVVAIDGDGDVLTYTLASQVPPHLTKFSINPATGEITTVAMLDYDEEFAVRNYELRIRVTDGTSNVDTVLNMAINDENDNTPVFNNYVHIWENAPPGTVVATVQAEDLDSGNNGRVSYEIIGGNKNTEFGLDSSSGVLYTRTELEYDLSATYELVIRAADSGTSPRSATTTLTVSVTEGTRSGSVKCSATMVVFVSAILGVFVLRRMT